jgi:hypothetical protein
MQYPEIVYIGTGVLLMFAVAMVAIPPKLGQRVFVALIALALFVWADVLVLVGPEKWFPIGVQADPFSYPDVLPAVRLLGGGMILGYVFALMLFFALPKTEA